MLVQEAMASPDKSPSGSSSLSDSITRTLFSVPENLNSNSDSTLTKFLSKVTNTHPMLTRSRTGIYKPKKMLHLPIQDLSATEPVSYKEASRHEHWRKAMCEEFDALTKQGTWSLVPHVPNQRLIGSKWVFQIKRDLEGNTARYKA